jgi:hypothetical protein
MGLGWQALGVFLGAEALGCVVLILPLPLDTKRSLLQFLSSNPHVAKAQSYLWVIFFLLLALFAGNRPIFLQTPNPKEGATLLQLSLTAGCVPAADM